MTGFVRNAVCLLVLAALLAACESTGAGGYPEPKKGDAVFVGDLPKLKRGRGNFEHHAYCFRHRKDPTPPTGCKPR